MYSTCSLVRRLKLNVTNWRTEDQENPISLKQT